MTESPGTRVALRPWQAAVGIALFVSGWLVLQWLALPYDGSDVKDAAPPLNLVPLAPVEADPAGAAPEAPTPWAAPERVVETVPVTIHVASGTGTVRVNGGDVQGTTPLDLTLPAGTHRIEVVVDGSGQVWTRDVEVEAGRPQTLVVAPD